MVSRPVAPFGARPRFILLRKSGASEGGAHSEGAFRDSEIKKGSSHWTIDNGIGPFGAVGLETIILLLI